MFQRATSTIIRAVRAQEMIFSDTCKSLPSNRFQTSAFPTIISRNFSSSTTNNNNDDHKPNEIDQNNKGSLDNSQLWAWIPPRDKLHLHATKEKYQIPVIKG